MQQYFIGRIGRHLLKWRILLFENSKEKPPESVSQCDIL